MRALLKVEPIATNLTEGGEIFSVIQRFWDDGSQDFAIDHFSKEFNSSNSFSDGCNRIIMSSELFEKFRVDIQK